MKSSLILPLLCETALCAGTVGIDIFRSRKTDTNRATRGDTLVYQHFLDAADANSEILPETLGNEFYAYYANMTLGSNDQPVNPMVDTGSSDLWVTSESNPFCAQTPSEVNDAEGQWNCTGFIYDSSTSSTFHNLSTPFRIKYLDTTGAFGWLIEDTVKLGGATIPNATFAVAETANSSTSVFGVGYAYNEATTRFYKNGSVTGLYPNLPVKMKQQGLIDSLAYSLYLNDVEAQTGQILFGGVDHEKYEGTLGLMPIYNTYYPLINHTIEFTIVFSGLSLRTGDSVCPLADFTIPSLLDSGTSYAILPPDIVNAMGEAMKFSLPSNDSYWQGLCSTAYDFDSFELDFLGKKLEVAPGTLLDVLQYNNGSTVVDSQGNDMCILAINSDPNEDNWILGDVFLRNFYVVYDLDTNQVAMAQSNFNKSGASNVEPIVSGIIPSATRVASYNSYSNLQLSVTTHSVAGACVAKPTSTTTNSSSSSSSTFVSASRSSAVSSGSAIASSGAATSSKAARSALSTTISGGAASASNSAATSNVAVSSSSSSPEQPTSTEVVTIQSSGAHTASSASAEYVTTVVSSFVTTCPTPTTFSTNGRTYTVTESEVLTITDCPCTLTHHASGAATAITESASTKGAAEGPSHTYEAQSTVVSSFETAIPTPTEFVTNGNTYTVTDSTVLTITDCPCTLPKETLKTSEPTGAGAPTSVTAAAEASSSSPLASSLALSPSSSSSPLAASSAVAVSPTSPSEPSAATVPTLANSASRVSTALATALGAAIFFFFL